MTENEIGYRGSKSVLKNNAVKEQRVDGNWGLFSFKGNRNATILSYKPLRCTLMGCESSYLVKIPSKQLNKLFYSTVSVHTMLNPYFVSGLIDGEGTFSTTIYKDTRYKAGWVVRSFFEIGLNQRDSFLIYQLQEFFGGVGTISVDQKADVLKYSVASINDLINTIIPHFYKFPLLTQKAADFILFVRIVELMSTGAHLSVDGLQQIINIKASINLGSSELIKSEFVINPVERPIIKSTNIPNPNWVSGFVSGEANFDVGIKKSKNIIGYQVYLKLRISQHERDIKLMKLLINYLGGGRIEKDSRNPVVYLVIGKISYINNIIIPFFNQYPILGTKYLDYLDWCKIANLMNLGSHLTSEGLSEIRKIKSGMNTNRK
jgi:hypothetical protein